MRLIDADELLERLKATDRYFMVKFDIERAPTVDLWKYPSRGEYPTEKELVLMKIPGCYVLGWYENNNWFMDYGALTVKCTVSRWQYIVPPEEEV